MVVAFAAGGSTDLIARVLSQRMGAVLGQTVIIENKGGADGAIGTAAVARATPDGYTIILSTTSTHVINPLLNKNITYNPATDFQPVSLVAQSPNILVSSLKFDAKSVSDVIARARAAPGTLNVATGATMHLLNAAMFKSMAGLTWVDVPYKGSGPALNDVMAGQVDLMFDQLPSSLAQVQGGRLKAVAVTSRQRTSIAPDIPTIAEFRLARVRGDVMVGRLRATKDAARNRRTAQRRDPSGARRSPAARDIQGHGTGSLAKHAGRTDPAARRRTRQAAFIDNKIEVN